MAMLHEVLAVENDHEGVVKKLTEEAKHTFKEKPNHFQEAHRTLKLFGAETEELLAKQRAEEQHVEMVTTVHDKLNYLWEHLTAYYDVVLQKERTNQDARSDLVVNGMVIAKDLPVTFLLGLETKLKTIRELYDSIPTLQPGVAWVRDEQKGRHIYRMRDPEVRTKTAKSFDYKILVPATDKHPAQVKEWEVTNDVGTYEKNVWSGMLSPAEKAAMIGRIDDLIKATKKARQRANETKIIDVHVGKNLMNYIHGE